LAGAALDVFAVDVGGEPRNR